MDNQITEIKTWLKQNARELSETAQTGYNNLGRGAVIVDFSNPNEATTTPDYISPEQLKQLGFSDKNLYRILTNYNPVREIIVAILFADGVKYYKLKAYPLAE